jgi:ABC-type sugar transport system ATPase subunit
VAASEAALAVSSIRKSFGGVHALRDVSLSFLSGRVSAVLGENGAGKSTLIRICSGAHRPDDGEIRMSGEVVSFASTTDAARRGIAVVHQEPQMVSEMTVAENIFLARLGERRATGLHHRAGILREARTLLQQLRLDADFPALDRLCKTLSAAERQLVEIARALAGAPRVLFLDEPNSSLTRRETERLFSIIRRLRDRGVAVVLVSHRLAEVYEIADHIIVLRDGCSVGEGDTATIPVAQAVRLMAGDRLQAAGALASLEMPAATGPVILSVTGAGGQAFRDVSFEIQAGEILGMAGLVGAGRTEIARAIIGADRLLGGKIIFAGKPVRFASPRQAVAAGIAFISEERRTSVFYGQDVCFNITASVIDQLALLGLVGRRRQRRLAAEQSRHMGVKAESIDTPIRSLSGGNQQKVLIGRALASRPKLLILDEPTRGVDVRTKAEIYALLRKLAHDDGLAVWFISSELDEILQLSDRILVIHAGRVADSLRRGPEATRVVASALGESLVDAVTALPPF